MPYQCKSRPHYGFNCTYQRYTQTEHPAAWSVVSTDRDIGRRTKSRQQGGSETSTSMWGNTGLSIWMGYEGYDRISMSMAILDGEDILEGNVKDRVEIYLKNAQLLLASHMLQSQFSHTDNNCEEEGKLTASLQFVDAAPRADIQRSPTLSPAQLPFVRWTPSPCRAQMHSAQWLSDQMWWLPRSFSSLPPTQQKCS